jgi:hypothetical protein
MLSGIQELLVIILIIMAIFFIPRITGKNHKKNSSTSIFQKISGKMRVAIVLSIIWPFFVAGYFQPWNGPVFFPFIYYAFGPVICGWSIFWIYNGYKKSV